MTLVVGCTSPAGAWLSADMRVTDCSAANAPGFARAALKLIVVDPTMCIGYAGRIGAANVALKHVHSERMGPSDAVEYLLAVHRREQAVDFVVAELAPSSLVEIKDGQATPREATWLGDAEAFAEYQRLFEEDPFLPPLDANLDEAFRAELEVAVPMNDAMQAVVLPSRDPDSSATRSEGRDARRTVGEAAVTVGPRAGEGVFGYHVYSNFSGAFGSRNALLSTEQGTFSLAFQVPTEAGVGAVGIYFEEGGFGILYAPLLTQDPEKPESLQGASAEEFREAVQARYGVSLRGSTWRPR
jgi:hypothetical protein